ncbi:hypothetical protein [Aeromonas salmonicida]|uniref:hypothetical protein n=1 Tax=Aeromonas salmonicida TaxID=645 RepID=UPI0031FD592B
MRVVTEQSEQVHHGENKAGIIIHDFLTHFDDTFNKSSHVIFENFFKNNGHIRKWMVFSDYALNDINKVNDVITFSILPYTDDFFERGKIIQQHSFKDIKKLKRVNKSFIDYINKNQILNISVLLDKDFKLDPYNEREMLKTCYKTASNQVAFWIRNEGEKERYKYLLSAYTTLLNEVSRQGANLRNIRNIEIVSNLAAYIIFQICISSKVDIIGWFSDRDAMLTHKAGKFKRPIIFDLVQNLFNNLMLSKHEGYHEKLVFGLPEPKGQLWYDSYNRIPDLIAATLADYDYINNVCSHDKFIPIIDNVLINKEKTITYKIFSEEHGVHTALITFDSNTI